MAPDSCVGAGGGCPSGWMALHEGCVQVSTGVQATYTQAIYACHSQGAALLSVRDNAELDTVRKLLPSGECLQCTGNFFYCTRVLLEFIYTGWVIHEEYLLILKTWVNKIYMYVLFF